MERPTRVRKQPSRFADFELGEDSGKLVSGGIGRGGRGGRGGRDGHGRQVGVADMEIFGDSGKMMKVRGGRVAVGGNRPIQPIDYIVSVSNKIIC